MYGMSSFKLSLGISLICVQSIADKIMKMVILSGKFPGGWGGGGTPYIFYMHMCRQNAPLFDNFSLAGHLKNGHLLSICPTNSQASQIIIDQLSLYVARLA